MRVICYSALNRMFRNGMRGVTPPLSICLAGLLLFVGCTPSDRRKEQQAGDEAREKARELSRKAKREAKVVSGEISSGIKSNSTNEAEAKLRNGGHELTKAGALAAAKLDRAATIACVKAKLASSIGFDTVSGVNVEVTGHDVTLSGKIASSEQKQAAGEAALEIPGVLKVHNNLQVAQ